MQTNIKKIKVSTQSGLEVPKAKNLAFSTTCEIRTEKNSFGYFFYSDLLLKNDFKRGCRRQPTRPQG